MQLDELRVYSCFRCGNIVSRQDDIVSTSFQSGNHRAFLLSHAKNVLIGTEEEKELITGLHKVCDVYCSDCELALGWMYVEAYSEDQKYKEGKVCLDQYKVLKQSL
ncbi:hypothetical protein K2173_003352 [Erythroxylum novogranatense]|uniref:Protein yippee-like n=1 Tax=Erythroxylum novogranatense TaxID=1862640 RepID=A0AAV8S8M0_9ROSI|nr:hypothetical protein K2173_003352 [Erythroxylum novogranatense]